MQSKRKPGTGMHSILILFVLMLAPVSYAAETHDIVQQEIQHLFEYLEKSDCQFNRNGKWYNADKAAKHIRKKYNYLTKRGLIHSAEQFIDRAASKSSMSGKHYMVQCGGLESVESLIWFTKELQGFREKASDTATTM